MDPIYGKKIKFLEEMAYVLRKDVVNMIYSAKSGHIAGSLDMAEIMATLYFHIINHNPKNPDWEDRDRVILSNGHVCPVLYAALARSGYFPVDELGTLRRINSRLQGHPHRESLPGVEVTSGPLGCGLSQAIGISLAARLDNRKYRIYCIMSDAEQQEGNVWEAFMFAGKNKLSNITAIIDRNNIQISGFTENIMPIDPLREKYESFNWHVLEINGHNPEELVDAVAEAQAIFEKPTVIIAHTISGKGVSFIEGDYKWHSRVPNEEESRRAIKELDMSRKRILDNE